MLWHIDDQHAAGAREGIKAWLLAPSIPVYQALIRGETVPADELNGWALERYGRRAA